MKTIELHLSQTPYVGDGDWFQATCHDMKGNFYTVKWDIINHETLDDSEACDWTQFTVKPLQAFDTKNKEFQIIWV